MNVKILGGIQYMTCGTIPGTVRDLVLLQPANEDETPALCPKCDLPYQPGWVAHWHCYHGLKSPEELWSWKGTCSNSTCPYHHRDAFGRIKAGQAMVWVPDHPCPVCLNGALVPYQTCLNCKGTGLDPGALEMFMRGS